MYVDDSLTVAKRLLDKGVKEVDCINYDRATPAVLAAALGHTAMLKLLLDRGIYTKHVEGGFLMKLRPQLGIRSSLVGKHLHVYNFICNKDQISIYTCNYCQKRLSRAV